MSESTAAPSDFVRTIVAGDVRNGKHNGRVVTRFPPEPNGFLHIGHVKAICINFEIAHEFGGRCHLRFDDTNPIKEDEKFARAIEADIRWLGYDWGEHLYYASDYFEQLYDFAVKLIKDEHAYVDSLSAEEIREYRGTLKEGGKESPYRSRTVEENLDLFERMRAGEFEDGAHLLRAKISMASPNLNLRDPALYRIRRATHPRTGDTWCIYPMYDYAHTLSDAIEGITHSLCTLEFEAHRPLYDWLLEVTDIPHRPQQIEFARLNVGHMITSKRNLRRLVDEGHVTGWDDPRMSTVAGVRRRGYPPEVLRAFCEHIGVAKRNGIQDIALLDHMLREHLNAVAPRRMGVLDPLKVVIDNYPEGKTEMIEAENNPEDAAAGMRTVPFSREIYVERGDFLEDPPRKFFRLSPGQEVRLKHAYYITCTDVIKDADGNVTELRCTYDPESRGGGTADGRKVRGTLHWVCAAEGREVTVRLYDHLFTIDNPGAADDALEHLNPESLVEVKAIVEPDLADADPAVRYQFLRHGYFWLDADSTSERPVFNRIVALRDSWGKKKG